MKTVGPLTYLVKVGRQLRHVDLLQARRVYPELLVEAEALDEPLLVRPSREAVPVAEAEMLLLPTPLTNSPVGLQAR